MLRSVRVFGFVLLAGLLSLSITPAQTKKGEPKENTKGGSATFELYVDAGGAFRFRIIDTDGVTKLGGSVKGYDTKEDCMKAVARIQELAGKAKIDDKTKAVEQPKTTKEPKSKKEK